MKIAIVGGGPGGLYFAALMKQLDRSHDITLWERNAASDTFGFGVVFSDETLGGIGNADPVVADYMSRRFARWSDIDIHFGGETVTVGGQGFARLRAAGIDVAVGPGAAESRELNIGFFSRMVRGTPWLRMKVAASLDGKTALDNGASQWITSGEARADGHAWRAPS